ncbi:MAG: glycosyltransferase [Candidatus Omnitrophica bacterium]|nr:glycosyltransferase [Candidatus Omnitrophota bacterium]
MSGLTLFIILAVITLIFEWNMSVYRPFGGNPGGKDPSVSILVPCRNEAEGIARNLKTLLAQDYSDYEVLVLDDNSDDGTLQILESLAAESSNLKVLRGKPLPSGWQGKNFACHELSEAARGEWLLFLDADTRHEPGMLRMAMNTARSRRADLLSTFPRQRFGSLGDELLVPMMFFVLLCFLPMYFVEKRTWKWAGNFSAACGQLLLISRRAYAAAGGHRYVGNRISEAPVLAERAKNAGFRITLRDGSRWVSCQMYRGFRGVWEGFSRSLFATMGGSVLTAVFFTVFMTYLFLWPYVILGREAAFGGFGSTEFAAALAAVLLPVWIRIRIHRRIGMPLKLTGFHALAVVGYLAIMFNSLIHYRFKKSTVWKNRRYDNPET